MQMKRSLAKQLIVITFFRILLNTGRRFVYPFAPALSRSLDIPLTAFTTVIAAGQFSALVGIFCGPLVDRIGYRFMMRGGMAMLAVGLTLCGLFPDYWFVLIGLILASFGKTLFDPAVQAFIGEYVPYNHRGRAVGIVEMAWAGSTLAAIPALGLIIDHIGVRGSFYILAFSGALGWLVLGFLLPRDNKETSSGGLYKGMTSSLLALFRSRNTAGMMLYGFWISIANDCLFVVYGAWFEQAFLVNVVTLGMSTIAIGGAELLGESCTALFSDRVGLKRSIIIGLHGAILAYVLLPFIGISFSLAMAGIFLVFFFFEFSIVTSLSLCTELVPGARATMMSGFFAMSGVGRMIGVLVGGSLWQHGGIKTVAFTAAGFTFLGLVSLLWGMKNWQAGAADKELEKQ